MVERRRLRDSKLGRNRQDEAPIPLVIERWRGSASGRSRAVALPHLGWVVANASDESKSLRQQIDSTLAILDARLGEIGSSRSQLLSVQVYLSTIKAKPQFDAAWERWIGPNPEHWPQRACVGVALSGGLLVEVVAVAVRSRAVLATKRGNRRSR
jgi:enamine deaminase RidA (YjgF/YER057c/UK114 family)